MRTTAWLSWLSHSWTAKAVSMINHLVSLFLLLRHILVVAVIVVNVLCDHWLNVLNIFVMMKYIWCRNDGRLNYDFCVWVVVNVTISAKW